MKMAENKTKMEKIQKEIMNPDSEKLDTEEDKSVDDEENNEEDKK